MIRIIIGFVFLFVSCAQKETNYQINYNQKETQLERFELTTDSLGSVVSFIFTHFNKDSNEFLAVWNEPLWSVDVYSLNERIFVNRYNIKKDGPQGIGSVDAITYSDETFYLFDANSKRSLLLHSDSSINLLNLRDMYFFDERESGDVFLSITPEFGSVPVILDEKMFLPIATQAPFESRDYYTNPPVGLFDLKTKQGVKSFGSWGPAYLKSNGYFGVLGEITLSGLSNGLTLSHPVSPEVVLFDPMGVELGKVWLASKDFPSELNGFSRSNSDLQEELDFSITQPWFLKIIFHSNNNSLIRFEKKRQELKKPDNTMNSTLNGGWTLLSYSLDSANSTINLYDLDAKELLLPISFPYKDGLLIKRLNDKDENTISFEFLRLE